MKKPTECLFSKVACIVEVDSTNDELRFLSSVLQPYIISEDIWLDVEEKILKNATDQGLANCSRRCLEIRSQNPKAIPLWIYRDEAAAYQVKVQNRNAQSKALYVLCIIEDYLNQSVDHSNKPYELLRAFSREMMYKDAYGPFLISIEHMLWARIANPNEYITILKFLISKSLVTFKPGMTFEGNAVRSRNTLHDPMSVELHITVEGWDQLGTNDSYSTSNKVFIATAFEWPENEDVRLQAVEAIKTACANLGYDADIVSQYHTDNISNKIMSQIRESSFVIAELTYHNRGVYFESGYARGLGKNVFHIVREGFTSTERKDDSSGKRIHFDIAQVLFKVWKQPDDLREGLEEWMHATVGKFKQ